MSIDFKTILLWSLLVVAGCKGGESTGGCEEGTAACACLTGELPCRGDLVCQAGVCVDPPCTAGEEGCVCTEGTLGCSCDSGNCTEGLLCQDGAVCVATTGFAGGTCLSNNTCRAGNACVSGVCIPCDVGSAGCSCFASGTCLGGTVCVEATCVNEPSEVIEPPADPLCYSPCNDNAVLADGSVRLCSEEDLLPGCVGNNVCEEGSCVPAGSGARACSGDIDCPDFQACMQGQCASNCEIDSDCPAGLGCNRKVCSLFCEIGQDDCARGQYCATVDGTVGFCALNADPEDGADPSVVEPTGTFAIENIALTFNNLSTKGGFRIVNNAPSTVKFTISKVRHVERSDTGIRTEVDMPLFWLSMGKEGATAKQQSFDVEVEGEGGTVEIVFTDVVNDTLPTWQGSVGVSSRLGKREVQLSYVAKANGRWAGKLYYFTSFADERLDDWLADNRSDAAGSAVGNAFIRRWNAFRQGRIPKLAEWLAVLTATRTGSWDWASTREACAVSGGACYLFAGANGEGAIPYSRDETLAPIPSGVVDFPIALHLQEDAADNTILKGRIDSSSTLQYPGNPKITLKFSKDPAENTSCSSLSPNFCLVPLDAFRADIKVGGRYLSGPGDNDCTKASGFELTQTPWLVPGFMQFTGLGSGNDAGRRYRYECRDTTLPFTNAVEGDVLARNLSMAQANPVPDGASRQRHLRLVDGALINNDTLFIIFQETFSSFLSNDAADDFAAYGYMLLRRNPADLEPADYVGNNQGDQRIAPKDTLGAACSTDLLSQITLSGNPVAALSAGNVSAVTRALIDGASSTAEMASNNFLPEFSNSAPRPHYLCVSSVSDQSIDNEGALQTNRRTVGYFDGGPGSIASGDNMSCPAGSTVRYFVMDQPWNDATIADLPCQKTGTCQDVFTRWVRNCEAGSCLGNLRVDPQWRCRDNNEVRCDSVRTDLRTAKKFYKATATVASSFVPLSATIDNAFRYRSRFRNRQGGGLGFAPSLCVDGGDALPYCYEASAVEEAADRLDCLVDIFSNRYAQLDASAKSKVASTLRTSFAFEKAQNGTKIADGFERLNAELLIMLGDDAYTDAFSSRFDLAGAAVYGFQGELFEPGGINLSGGAGFEMHRLYQATQYYQLVLDRFYALLPQIWQSVVGQETARQFISIDTIASYFDRLIRASSQKSRAFSEIALRYQSFNRPELARGVVERSYASAYMESVILSHLMLRMGSVVKSADRPQIAQKTRRAALAYRSALLRMRRVYADLTDDLNFFGFAPDYVPFPALSPGENNAFEKLFVSAQQKIAVAAAKEERALRSKRSYDTDAVSFQNELSRIGINYDGQLAQLCGTFIGDDAEPYPAIEKYAALSGRTRLLGNPCGLVGNGAIYQAIGGAELAGLNLQSAIEATERLLGEMEIEGDRAEKQCAEIESLADFQLEQDGKIKNLSNDMQLVRDRLGRARRVRDEVQKAAQLLKCGGYVDCLASAVAAGAVVAAATVYEGVATFNEKIIRRKQSDIAELQAGSSYKAALSQCTMLNIDSTARLNSIALGLFSSELDVLKAEYQVGLALSDVEKQRNEALRLASEQRELEQQTINLEAARNDPNVRIYKNDSILTADRTFKIALREAYRATKVYEYYTSQSYEALGDLFLVRMVANGDISLEAYLDDLGAAFYDYGEAFGAPDVRVHIVSMRDDIFAIPYYDGAGQIMSSGARVSAFREALSDPALLDARGYTSVDFSTTVAALSPLTYNHKIRYIEAEIIGSDVGDTIGRLYLQQNGTNVIRGIEETLYYAFPERTAVLNPFFNGQRTFTPEVYRSERLRDRPVANTRWQAVLNQRDERVNQDISVNALTDIRFYIYYTDFTAL